MITMPPKDPGEVLDYSIDWSAALGTDTISSSQWSTTSGGVIVGTSSISGKTTIVWLSFGIAGITATIKNTITTAAGRTLVQSLKVPVAIL